jgi:uncharacterized protein YaaN involved in tellurite resistance
MTAQPKASGNNVSLAVIERYRDEFEGGRSNASGDRRAAFDDWLEQLTRLDPAVDAQRDMGRDLAETWGADAQLEAARQSELLRKPLSALSRKGGGGGEVGDSLVALKMAVEKVDPGKFNFEPGWFLRLVGKLPGVGQPLERYATRYRSARSVIDAILKALERGRDELSRDIVTLTEDQRRFREATGKLEVVIANAQRLDQELEARCQRIEPGESRRKFLEEEVLFPLRQRILDLQQQLAVSQQGVIACDLIVRNNKELIRGVNRAIHVTATALEVGATVALALETQKRVLTQIETTAKATNDLIAGTAQRLRTQGVEIHRQAAGTTLDLATLRRAFDDLNAAMDELGRFRQEALPQMAQTVREFDQLTKDGEEAIRRMERLRRSESRIGQVFRR